MKWSIVLFLQFLSICIIAENRNCKFDIIIENDTEYDRLNEPVVINTKSLKCGFDIKSVVVTDNGKPIPGQLDDLNGDMRCEELAFLVNIASKEKKRICLVVSNELKDNAFENKTHAQILFKTAEKEKYVNGYSISASGNEPTFTILHHHGVAFENEKVAYRIYFDQRQTLDLYGKKHKRLELADTKFYPTKQQLQDGFGNDVIWVGTGCGAGSLRGWDGNNVAFITPVDKREQRILTEGPVRTIVETRDVKWNYHGKLLNMTSRYTLYAGRRDVRIDVKFDLILQNEFFSTGVQNIGGNSLSFSDHEGLIASWGSNYPEQDTTLYKKETIGLSTYIPKQYVVDERKTDLDYLYILNISGQKGFTYFTSFIAAKENIDGLDGNRWFKNRKQWKELLDSPCIVRINVIEH